MLSTSRLRLRIWRENDLPPFAAMNADPRVMEFLPKVLNREESDALAGQIIENLKRDGFGLWAVEVPEVADFIGFVGLNAPTFEAHFTPCIEIGWRLAFEHWGRGYATEAATAVLKHGFEQLGLNEVVSFTVPANARSRRVMTKIGMTYSPADDFDHPRLPQGDSLRRHVLYRMSLSNWTRRCPIGGLAQ
jgi:RimJ/RimL family protein N-acetyltransferase